MRPKPPPASAPSFVSARRSQPRRSRRPPPARGRVSPAARSRSGRPAALGGLSTHEQLSCSCDRRPPKEWRPHCRWRRVWDRSFARAVPNISGTVFGRAACDRVSTTADQKGQARATHGALSRVHCPTSTSAECSRSPSGSRCCAQCRLATPGLHSPCQ
jgi:hypothetical protein